MNLDINIWLDDSRGTWHLDTYQMEQDAEGLWKTDTTDIHESWQVEVYDIAHTPAVLCYDWWVDTEDKQYALIERLMGELRAA